jgi:hypothetical protein
MSLGKEAHGSGSLWKERGSQEGFSFANYIRDFSQTGQRPEVVCSDMNTMFSRIQEWREAAFCHEDV